MFIPVPKILDTLASPAKEMCMSKGKDNKPKVNIWDHRPRSDQPDDTTQKLFHAVGLALSQWEHLQTALDDLFMAVVKSKSKGLKRAIGLRMDALQKVAMLKEAARDIQADEVRYTRLMELLNKVSNFNERRNEIAHGVVYGGKPPFLGPTHSTTKKFMSTKPPAYLAYSMQSSDIKYFVVQFMKLKDEAVEILCEIYGIPIPRVSK
jgi:hypothetical protein